MPTSLFAYDVEKDGIYYNIVRKAKIAEITSGEKKYSGEIKIPSTVNIDNEMITVSKIGAEAFNGCSSLTSVVIPTTITTIGFQAFHNCTSLSSISIPNSVESIGEAAFCNCSSLTSIIIPNSVKNIARWVFYDCTALLSVTIPNSVRNIDESAFWNCKSLSEVYINDIGAWCEIEFGENGANPLNYAKGLFCENQLITDLVVPNTVKTIGKSAFCGYESLTSVTLPNSVTCIEENAFLGCSSLSAVTISNSVITIGKQAFSECISLKSIVIPNSVKNIMDMAFWRCSSLTSIIIPNSVAFLGQETFKFCTALSEVSMGSSVQKLEKYTFSECKELSCVYSYSDTPPVVDAKCFENSYIGYVRLYVPKESVELYKAADVWKDFGNIKAIEGDDTDNINLVKTRGVMVTTDNDITISGLNDGEVVTFYSVSGVNLGSAKAVQGIAHFAKPNERIVIAKTKGCKLKIAIK